MKTNTVIRNGIILSMVEGQAARMADVHVKGDRIVDIQDSESDIWSAEGVEIVEATGCVVMPGLINTHTHTPMTIMRSTMDGLGFPSPDSPSIFPPGMDWRGGLTSDDHALATRLAQLELIRTGTTTFVDMYHDMDRVAEAVVESGLRAALGSEIHDFRNDPDEWLPYDEEVAKKSFEQSASFASEWNGKGSGRVMTMVAPHETSTCREPWLSRAADLAEQLGLGITLHVAESSYEVEYCKEHYGMTPVEVMQEAGVLERRVIGAHSVLLTNRDIEILARANYTAASCLQSYLKLSTEITPVPKLREAGVRIGIGTDSALTNNNLNLWEELYLTASLHGFLAKDPAILSPEDVLRMATVSGAEAIGLGCELGTIEVGKKADIIILEMSSPNLHPYEGVLVNNLVYAANGNEVRDVMVDGTFIMRDRKVLTLDEVQILSDVRRRVRELRKRVGLPERFERP